MHLKEENKFSFVKKKQLKARRRKNRHFQSWDLDGFLTPKQKVTSVQKLTRGVDFLSGELFYFSVKQQKGELI